jgi:hypothetical protein
MFLASSAVAAADTGRLCIVPVLFRFDDSSRLHHTVWRDVLQAEYRLDCLTRGQRIVVNIANLPELLQKR